MVPTYTFIFFCKIGPFPTFFEEEIHGVCGHTVGLSHRDSGLAAGFAGAVVNGASELFLNLRNSSDRALNCYADAHIQ